MTQRTLDSRDGTLGVHGYGALTKTLAARHCRLTGHWVLAGHFRLTGHGPLTSRGRAPTCRHLSVTMCTSPAFTTVTRFTQRVVNLAPVRKRETIYSSSRAFTWTLISGQPSTGA